ncbi:hypothetical protein AHAS_Ahas19G0201200 [Arachis hypogaea]
MIICSTAFVRDVKMEIPNIHTTVMAKEKEVENYSQIQSLNAILVSLQEGTKALQSKEKINTLSKIVMDAERATVYGVFDAERNMVDQIKPLSPELDTSSMNAFKKGIDNQVVDIM